MAVYFISEINEIIDPERYALHVARIKDVVEAHCGRYLVRAEAVAPVSGDWRPQKLIVIEFADRPAVQDCLESDEYREIAPLREASARGWAVVAEGWRGDG